MEIYKLQIFARWGSDVILRYVADSPLSHVRLQSSSSSSSSSPADKSHIAELSTEVAKLAAFVEDAIASKCDRCFGRQSPVSSSSSSS